MKKYWILLLIVLFLAEIGNLLGVGYYSGGSAVVDLKEELTVLHGMPYTGRVVENGTEDMFFSVEPETFFLTNYNLRNYFGLDYRYRCTVTYRFCAEDDTVTERTVTYLGIDPMGPGKEYDRAYLEPWNGR